MKHKCEWETMNNSTRCILCGTPKNKAVIDREAHKEYMRQYHLDNPRKAVKV